MAPVQVTVKPVSVMFEGERMGAKGGARVVTWRLDDSVLEKFAVAKTITEYSKDDNKPLKVA